MDLKIGCNNSEELISLLINGECKVDYIKLSFQNEIREEIYELDYPGLPETVKRIPLLIHTLPDVGDRRLLCYAEELRKLKGRIRLEKWPRHVASHLWLGDDWCGSPEEDNIKKNVIKVLKCAKGAFEKLGCDFLIENVPYHGQSGWAKTISSAGFLADVINSTGVKLLLILGHLKITSHYLSSQSKAVTRSAYLKELFKKLGRDLRCVREIHVSGAYIPNETPSHHRHFQLEEDDYELIYEVLSRLKKGRLESIIVTLEYAGTGKKYRAATPCDPIALREQLKELRSRFGS